MKTLHEKTLLTIKRARERASLRSQLGVAEKERRRIQRAKVEPIRKEWRGVFAFTWTFHNRISGEIHSMDFYISQKRINSYAVFRDGALWKKQISLSDALAKIRKAIPRFTKHDA